MKVIKKQSKKTYVNKEGKDKHFYNYYLQLDNGTRICVKAITEQERFKLDAVAEYEGSK